jgi:nicotinamide riboside transporter PnuC
VFEIFKWLVAGASLVGVVLNIRRRRECFFVWAVTNASWTIVDVYHGISSQAALQAVYFCLALWGIVALRKRDECGEGS